jgi:hypothetical protein
VNVQESVRTQLGFWHGVVDGMVADCGPDVAHKNVDGATITSIAAVYAHVVFSEDAIVHGMLQGKPTIYQNDGWEAKTGVAFPGPMPSLGDWAKSLQMNVPAFQQYAKEVWAATDAYLSSVSEADLEKKVQTPAGEQNVAWAISVILGTHTPQHTGEIAALKGVQGLKGLPF